MYRILLGLAIALLMTGPVFADDKSDAVAPIRQFIDGFNKGDVATALAACAEHTSIVDEFPPHEWTSCEKWANDFDADAKKRGITDAVVTMDNPKHVDITGDRAYVVIPVGYTYKMNGKPMQQTGSTLTAVLAKSEKGWRMTSWTWSTN